MIAVISTREGYDTLQGAIASIANQTLKPEKLLIYDDNDIPKPIDLKDIGIAVEVIAGQKQGPHYNHFIAQSNYDGWIWRMEDNQVAEPDVLEKLSKHIKKGVGAVISNNIESFIYRSGIANNDLRLSIMAYGEAGYFLEKIMAAKFEVINEPEAVVRTVKDRKVIRLALERDRLLADIWRVWKDRIIVLLGGIGAQIVCKKILPEAKGKIVSTCYPLIFKDYDPLPLEEAERLLGNLGEYEMQNWMEKQDWIDTIEASYRKRFSI